MVDLPLTLPAAPRSAALTPATTTGTTAVQVSLTSLPAGLQDLQRLLQINATPVAASDSSEVTLSTSYGNLTVTLAQQLSTSTRQEMVHHLMTLVRAHRSLTMTIQPGTPPTQGALIIPTAPALPQAPATRSPIPSTPAPQAIAVGKDFQAVVLPKLSPTTQTFAPPIQPPPSGMATPAYPIQRPSLAASTPLPTPSPAATEPMTTPLLNANQSNTPSETPRPPVLPQAFQAYTSYQSSQTRSPQPLSPAPSTATPQTSPQAPLPTQEPLRTDSSFSTRPPTTLSSSPPQPSTVSPSLQPLSTQPQQAVNPQPPSPLAALLSEGNEVTLHIDAVVLPKAPPPALQPNQILATVAGTGTGGQLILDAGEATLFVKSDITAPTGTTLVVSVDAAENEPLMVLPSDDVDQRLPTLTKLAEALTQANPQLFHHVADTRIPQSSEGLAGALLFFFGTFKRGDVRGWLGDSAVDALGDKGNGPLVTALVKEFAEASQPVRDPVVGQWQSYPIPLYSQQQFQSLTLYVHNDRDAPHESSRGSANTGKIRFLIDMRLSRLGDMQVDGFVQPKKLDMILRSEAILPEGLHHELREAYIKALGAVGYTGSLNFQVGRQFWMTMPKAAPKGIVT